MTASQERGDAEAPIFSAAADDAARASIAESDEWALGNVLGEW